jgi:prolyl oligopeptidase
MNGLPTSITEFTTDGRLIGSVVPESSIPVSQVELTGDAFYTTTPVDDKTYVHRWCLNSNEVEVVDIPQDRAIQLHSVLNNTSTSLFLTYESFVTPSCFVEYRPGVGATCLSQGSLPTPMENHPCVQRRTYPSRDKTEISISIVSSNLGRNTATPILLSAYGGFGVSVTPQFSVLANILIENGACFAIPEVRGGSEKGPEWHDAARGINRQRAFDDFIAAAEWLCQQGLTSPHRLAICGGSNAGLLVGAVMTQRPELFRAVLCIAPLLDMVRYEQFDNAKRWIKEFGTVSSPSDFAALLSYSPYHRIKDDVNYPATLFVTGAKDERCNPAHVRKTAARLQDRPAQHHPILVDHTPQRGHAPTMPLSIRIEALAVRLAFLCNELGIAPGRPQ